MSESKFYAYVGNHATGVTVLSLSPETGKMAKLQEVRIRGDKVAEDVRGGRFIGLALSPNNRFLYVSNRTFPYSIHTFAIDGATGSLTHLLESPTAESPNFISTDRTGRFLLASHNPPDRKRRTGMVSVAAINEGMALAPHQVIHTPPKTHSILTDPSNRFAMAPACDADLVIRFHFDVNTGTLNPDGLAPLYTRPAAGPRHHRYHPNGKFIYMDNEFDGTIYCYSFDARNGAVAEIQIAHSRPPKMDKEGNVRASDLRFTPDGKWLYVGVRGTSCMAIFGCDPVTGLLTLKGHVDTPLEPRGFYIDPFGRYLLHSAYLSNSVIAYKINSATGELTKAADIAIDGPNWIKIVRLP